MKILEVPKVGISSMKNLPFDYKEIIQLAQEAAKAIIEVKSKGFDVEKKGDESPVTAADLAASKVINEKLSKMEWPIINEETQDAPYSERKNWSKHWLVDPLDGTKEFIKGTDEYTVNIAFVVDQKPVWGVIVQPENQNTFFGGDEYGSYRILNGEEEMIVVKDNVPKQFFISRSHHSEEGEQYLKTVKDEYEIASCGSSLKFCRIAEGSADEYPRFGPTMEWDTCAGQAILEGAGGSVIDWNTKESLKYNKENLLNPFFIAKNK